MPSFKRTQFREVILSCLSLLPKKTFLDSLLRFPFLLQYIQRFVWARKKSQWVRSVVSENCDLKDCEDHHSSLFMSQNVSILIHQLWFLPRDRDLSSAKLRREVIQIGKSEEFKSLKSENRKVRIGGPNWFLWGRGASVVAWWGNEGVWGVLGVCNEPTEGTE